MAAPHPAARTILVHAHRGGRAFRPENTLAAFTYGIEVGADVLEMDLAVTRDDVLVVSHSPYLTQPFSGAVVAETSIDHERQCEGPPLPAGTSIRSLTLTELRQYDCGVHPLPHFPKQIAVPHSPIPTFDEVLDLAPHGTFGFNVETKIFPASPELTPTPEEFAWLIAVAVRRRSLQNRILVQSFDFRTLHAMQHIAPQIRRAALIGLAEDDILMGSTDPDKDFAHLAEVSGAHILSPDQSLVTPEAVALAHGLGLQVVPYTVNTLEGWRRMADAGVDAVITDDPAGCLAWLRAQVPPLHA